MSASLKRSMYRSMVRETAVNQPRISGIVIIAGAAIAGVIIGLAVSLGLGR